MASVTKRRAIDYNGVPTGELPPNNRRKMLKNNPLHQKPTDRYYIRPKLDCPDLPAKFWKTMPQNKCLPVPTKSLTVHTPQEYNRRCLSLKTNNKRTLKKHYYSSPLNFSQSKYKRDNHSLNYAKLYQKMIITSIGKDTMIEYNNCPRELEFILKDFLHRHTDFQYHHVLRTLLNKNVSTTTKSTLQVTLKQYQQFINSVAAYVIPKKLYGSNRNLKKLKKAMEEYYLSGYKVTVNLKPNIGIWDISQVKWLKTIKNDQDKHIIMSKIMKWFFESFFIPMIYSLFKQQKNLYNEKRIMMRHEKWESVQRDYIQRGLREGRFEKIEPDDKFKLEKSPWPSMSLHVKLNGIRAILRVKHSRDHLTNLATLKVFLKQIYLQRFGKVTPNTFLSDWKTETAENPAEKTHIVSCDVSDAYGSINQDKLMTIINDLIAEIPQNVLTLRWYMVTSQKKQWLPTTVSKIAWFSNLPTPPSVKQGSKIKTAIDDAQNFHKKTIQTMLKKIILDQYFTFGDKHYKLAIGIAQGMKLGSILSDIYYQHMAVQEFSIFKQSGQLSLYVDDFIYITKNIHYARRFLKMIKKNVPQYNCYFSKKKIQTNVESRFCRKSEWVRYLGYEVNGSTKELRPLYYNTYYEYYEWMKYIVGKDSVRDLEVRSKNLSILKLNPTVLDPTINGHLGIAAIAGLAAEILAKRIVILVSRIFNNVTLHAKAIMKHIFYLINKLIGKCCKHLTANDREKWPSVQKGISTAIYKSFNRILSKNQNCSILFCNDIKRKIINLDLM